MAEIQVYSEYFPGAAEIWAKVPAPTKQKLLKKDFTELWATFSRLARNREEVRKSEGWEKHRLERANTLGNQMYVAHRITLINKCEAELGIEVEFVEACRCWNIKGEWAMSTDDEGTARAYGSAWLFLAWELGQRRKETGGKDNG